MIYVSAYSDLTRLNAYRHAEPHPKTIWRPMLSH